MIWKQYVHQLFIKKDEISNRKVGEFPKHINKKMSVSFYKN